MKYSIRYIPLILILFLLVAGIGFRHALQKSNAVLSGAWEWQDSTGEHILLFTENYYTNTVFQKSSKQFIDSYGGTYQVEGNQLNTKLEYHTGQSGEVGQTHRFPFAIESDKLTVTDLNISAKRLDDGSGPLAGTWRISGRMQDGKMTDIESGPRKTLKILSGTRFQWVAMNTETKEFFGTGGGMYTFIDGKYMENIDFFSRDSSRVGVSLSFDGKVENDQWHHSGQSSKGEVIHEVWSRVKE